MKIKDLKKGEWFTFKNVEYPTAKQVWIRGHYDRATKTYSVCCFDDVNKERFVKANKEVFTEFIF